MTQKKAEITGNNRLFKGGLLFSILVLKPEGKTGPRSKSRLFPPFSAPHKTGINRLFKGGLLFSTLVLKSEGKTGPRSKSRFFPPFSAPHKTGINRLFKGGLLFSIIVLKSKGETRIRIRSKSRFFPSSRGFFFRLSKDDGQGSTPTVRNADLKISLHFGLGLGIVSPVQTGQR